MIEQISKQISLRISSVSATIKLLEEGATIPFIARYRKEATGNLDEVEIASVRDTYEALKELNKRKEYIFNSIDSQGLMTDKIKEEIDNCNLISDLEDLYLPFKPKRNTKAEIARKKGLEPLAKIISAQNNPDIEYAARRYVGHAMASDTNEAIEGAGFIVAEWMSENSLIRKKLRIKVSNR